MFFQYVYKFKQMLPTDIKDINLINLKRFRLLQMDFKIVNNK